MGRRKAGWKRYKRWMRVEEKQNEDTGPKEMKEMNRRNGIYKT